MTFEDYFNYDWFAKAQEVYEANHQWWHDLNTGEKLTRNPKTLLALMSSEISEGLEGLRKNRYDDHLPHRKMIEVEIADHLIRTLDFIVGTEVEIFPDIREYINQEEMANFLVGEYLDDDASAALYDLEDAMHEIYIVGGNFWFNYILTICAYAIKFDLDLMGAMEEKIEYNKHRADHKKEARLAQGGKSF